MNRQRIFHLLIVAAVTLFAVTAVMAEPNEGTTVSCPDGRNGDFENPPRLFYMECLDEDVVIGGGFTMEWCITTTSSGNEIHKMRYHLKTATEDVPYFVIRDYGDENETTYYAIHNRMNYHQFHGPIDTVHYNEYGWVESETGERLKLQFAVTPDGLRHGSCPITFLGPVKPRAESPTWSVVKKLYR
jgi:hypothetical protein